jgi:hypothetical protein
VIDKACSPQREGSAFLHDVCWQSFVINLQTYIVQKCTSFSLWGEYIYLCCSELYHTELLVEQSRNEVQTFTRYQLFYALFMLLCSSLRQAHQQKCITFPWVGGGGGARRGHVQPTPLSTHSLYFH